MADQKKAEMVKVKILKPVGAYLPGQEVELEKDVADHLADGKRAMLLDDHKKMEAQGKDVNGMSVAQMQAKGLKNVPEQVRADAEVYAKAEQAALNGVPVASGEPLTVTGGVTPPTLVHPALAKAAGQAVTDAGEVKKASEEKKAEAKKEEKKLEEKK